MVKPELWRDSPIGIVALKVPLFQCNQDDAKFPENLMLKKVLVTFDIDGTLFNAANSRHVQMNSLIAAYREIFGKDPIRSEFLGAPVPGATDCGIAAAIFKKAGVFPSRHEIARFLNIYDQAVLAHEFIEPHTFPGVERALTELVWMNDVYIAIASGCTIKTALKKLRAIGLDSAFTPFAGGFGENNLRSQCILLAKQQTERFSRVKIDHVIHVGDTPGDVFAAYDARAHPFAVLTGKHKRSDFPDKASVLPNLEVGRGTLVDAVAALQELEL